MSTVLVYADLGPSPESRLGGKLPKQLRELLTLAAGRGELAIAASAQLPASIAAELNAYGPVVVYQPSVPDLAESVVGPASAYLAAVIQQASPSAVLLDNSYRSREIAARLAVRAGSGVITGAGSINSDWSAEKSVLAGTYTTRCRVTRGIPILTVRAGSGGEMQPTTTAVSSSCPAAVTILVPAMRTARVTDRQEKQVTARPRLSESQIIVAGGRGTNGDFLPVENLADALGGAVGASRAAVDAGWIEAAAQVGQTGKTVAPQVYISCGISGAIQHKAGMQTSKLIIAINKDADSPVFDIADFGIVGDLFKVIPQAVTELVQQRG